MNTLRLAAASVAAALISTASAQQPPTTWQWIGGAQGWPQERSGRAIHWVHVPPTNPAMGNRGKIIFWGRNNFGDSGVRPHTWTPAMAWESGFGTFGRTLPEPFSLTYEAFCCGQTLMEDGKIAITGTNFNSDHVPLRYVATYNPATNMWLESPESYWLNKARYYPTTIRMPGGRIGTFAGQAMEDDPDTPGDETAFVVEPFEMNPSVTNLLAPWLMPELDDYDLLNYPFIYPISATEVFFAGGGRHHGTGGLESYDTFTFDTSGASIGGRIPYGGNADLWHGTPIMYKPGFVLVTGDVESRDPNNEPDPFTGKRYGGTIDRMEATTNTQIIDITQTMLGSLWTYKADMNSLRIDHNMAVLPTGRVFAAGATKYHGRCGLQNHAPWCRELTANWVQSAEIWNPVTDIWTSVAAIGTILNPVFRGYHSTIGLLPDARVYLGGGDVGWPTEYSTQPPSAQIYLPDYAPGTRPEITAGPDQIAIGSANNTVTVSNSNVNQACLIALGAITNSVDMNARYIPVTLGGTGLVKSFSGPVSNVVAPYGWYMLFVLKPGDNGQPLRCKMAKYVKIVPPADS
ncbi:MAG: galactose oxidase-like domain-containing protein [Fimbriimonadales bacterium]